jgi:hypothetical protein
MPIVSRTLNAGETCRWLITGSGFSIVAASGLLSRIEFLRHGKVIEDMGGQFGEGFFFTSPPGTVFDGVQITALNSGAYSVFIGHGHAGIIETDNARPVNVTNSALAVDVQNSVLNANITNSLLDIDIQTQTVELQSKNVGVAGNQPGPTALASLSCTSSTLTLGSLDVAEIFASLELYLTTAGSCPANSGTVSIVRVNGGATIWSKTYAALTGSQLCSRDANNALREEIRISDSFNGSTQYRILGSGGGGSPAINFRNANIRVTK